MKIGCLVIRNFRGIVSLDTGTLGDTVIVAGQNGSGKSCIFDAIRLLKSVYGGYQQNEWQNFFNEFQIQLHGGSKNLRGLFNNPNAPIFIQADFILRDREKAYITANASALVEEMIWQALLPEAFQYGGYSKALFAAQFRERQPEVTKRVLETLPQLQRELSQSVHIGLVTISPDGQIMIQNSHVLSVAFTNYRPREIGVIDYHGAQRHYGREAVGGINLNLDQAKQVRSQSSLYNYNAKYGNVKSEMAGNYVAELLAETAARNIPGASDREEQSLARSMQELFSSFFPDKKFLGPKPTLEGSLAFPVQTQSGNEHDLDELSSGEKEILYGYLRIRSSAPRDSIILLDEPELHLNPRLISGLPEFYRRHLGEGLQNQLWLVTHSDALIREAVGKPGFNVFHMLPCGADISGSSQLKPLVGTGDLELVLTDLVGDLASYRPGGKGVIFEGGGDSDFDKTLVSSLFPLDLRGVNLISGSNKAKVRALHEVLARAYAAGDLPTKFFAVTDRDSDPTSTRREGVTEFCWNVYHIENYLLEATFVAEAANSYKLGDHKTLEEIDALLADAARQVVPALLIHEITKYANETLVSSINLGFNPATLTISKDLRTAVQRSADRLADAVGNQLSEERLAEKEDELRRQIESSFSDGTWRAKLPGRDILKKFVSLQKVPTNYEAFRNQIVSRMAAKGYQPPGMLDVIQKIKAG